MTTPRMESTHATPARRPYEEPTLRTFGSVTALTQALSTTGKAMDGGPNNLKT